MKKNRIIIYLAELAHEGFGLSLNNIPLGIGCVGAYSKKIFQDDILLYLFRRFTDLKRAVSKRPPHIVGFGYYSWNDNLTLAAADFVKRTSPETLTVLGGSNISFEGWENEAGKNAGAGTGKTKACAMHARDNDLALLRQNPSIDLIVHGDGEIPFSNIVERVMDCTHVAGVKADPIDGCSALAGEQLITGRSVKPLFDLDVIPSPYLNGLYRDFLDRFRLTPQIETVRGCPYECAYCTIGGNTNRLRKHSLDYIREEILYLKENSPNRILRISDSNWGILKRDIRVAEFIRDLHDTHGYPSSLRVYYAEKGPLENVRQMADALKSLLPLNMSFQTLTKDVLKNINRKNMPPSGVRQMVEFAHENNIAVSTELISGLPGESAESFKKVFEEVVRMNFDSVYVGPLYLIKGSELHTEGARKRYGYKTMYALIGKDVTRVNDHYACEADEVVVQSNTMSQTDFWEIYRFNFFIFCCYGAAFLKEMIMHCLNHHVTPLEIYDEIFSDPKAYPFTSKTCNEYVANTRGKYFGTFEELRSAIDACIEGQGNIDDFSRNRQMIGTLARVLCGSGKVQFIADLARAARAIVARKGREEDNAPFHHILDILTEIAADIIISPMEPVEQEIVRKSNYDLVAWARDAYKRPLDEYYSQRPLAFSLQVRNIKEHRDLFDMAKGMERIDQYVLYFSTTVSSNMRRFIAYH